MVSGIELTEPHTIDEHSLLLNKDNENTTQSSILKRASAIKNNAFATVTDIWHNTGNKYGRTYEKIWAPFAALIVLIIIIIVICIYNGNINVCGDKYQDPGNGFNCLDTCHYGINPDNDQMCQYAIFCDDYYLYNNKCVSECPYGSFIDDKSNIFCKCPNGNIPLYYNPNEQNCKEWIECDINNPYIYNGACVSNCPYGIATVGPNIGPNICACGPGYELNEDRKCIENNNA